MSKIPRYLPLMLAATLLLLACDEDSQAGAGEAPQAEAGAAPQAGAVEAARQDEAPPPLTTHEPTTPAQGQEELPPGHPPVDGSAGSFTIPAPPPDSGTGSSALEWTVPEGWVAETPSSSMRRAQYRVPGPGGDGQCVVFYFGPGQGGGAMANAQRWAGQFAQPDGRPASEAMKTELVEVNGVRVLTVEVTGNYTGGMGSPGQALENAMLLGAIAEGPDANWFFKLTGPEATLRQQKAAFEALYGSLRTPVSAPMRLGS